LRSIAALRKEAELFCGSFLRNGEMFTYVRRNQDLTDLKHPRYLAAATRNGERERERDSSVLVQQPRPSVHPKTNMRLRGRARRRERARERAREREIERERARERESEGERDRERESKRESERSRERKREREQEREREIETLSSTTFPGCAPPLVPHMISQSVPVPLVASGVTQPGLSFRMS
jgi:hypothetical protein